MVACIWKFYEVVKEDESRARCKLCNVTLSRGGPDKKQYGTSNLNRHMKRNHPNEFESIAEKNSKAEKRKLEPYSINPRCSECGYTKALKKDVIRHIEAKHLSLRIHCLFCLTVLTTRLNLQRHLKNKHLQKTGNPIADRNNLKNMMRDHLGE